MPAKKSNALTGKSVLDILDYVCGRRELVNMRLHGEPPTVSTRIREIYADKKSMQIEAFQNGEIDRGMRQGDELEGTFQYGDLQYHFLCQYRGVAGLKFHRVSVPTRLDSLQRRETFRVKPTTEAQVAAQVWYKDDKPPVHAEVEDISIGGIRLLPLESDVEWKPDMRLKVYVGFTEAGERFTVEATVQHLVEDPNGKLPPSLGVRFDPLSPVRERFLGRLVMHWQREHLKREKELELNR